MSTPSSSPLTFADILQALSEPFPVSYLEFKPGAISKSRDRALALTYVDPRRYQERLDVVCPGWQSRVEVIWQNGTVIAKVALTIEHVTREEIGEAVPDEVNGANLATSAVAQAFKRACAAFGLGRYLYYLPQQWLKWDDERKVFTEQPRLPNFAYPLGDFDLLGETPTEPNEPSAFTEKPSPTHGKGKSAKPGVESITPESLDPASFVVPFGKNKGRTLAELGASREGVSWIKWAAESSRPTDEQGELTKKMAQAYLLLNGQLGEPEAVAEEEDLPF